MLLPDEEVTIDNDMELPEHVREALRGIRPPASWKREQAPPRQVVG